MLLFYEIRQGALQSPDSANTEWQHGGFYSMSVEKAMDAYTREKLNCAQSVLRGFQEQFQVEEERIAKARSWGGGRAENGLCGALHAARILGGAEDVQERFRERFIESAGSDRCREIRSLRRLSCKECVELAARLLEEESAN